MASYMYSVQAKVLALQLVVCHVISRLPPFVAHAIFKPLLVYYYHHHLILLYITRDIPEQLY